MGVAIAKELLDVAMDHFNGIYLMTPFMLYEMSAQLLEHVWAKSGHPATPLFH
ncbi:5,10-methylenetetrahydrofolate reductase [Paenibacillus pini JCM 16418]|uniref:5,10-methylenetetrahydrofolate reductase n=1 Tax=Paenibacillus pini JCM 16418 TaxID=1236976 RepID=W7Y8E4_9BACL|nr:5,10-methylenetetrahydrofolate reductase [Paenibacillus pini JCM 16418]